NVLRQRRSLGTERAAVDRMIGIAFDVHDLGDRVLRLVSQRVDNHAATDGTVRTRAAGFAGTGNLKPLGLGMKRGQVESQSGESGTPCQSPFQKGPAGKLHKCLRVAIGEVRRLMVTTVAMTASLGCSNAQNYTACFSGTSMTFARRIVPRPHGTSVPAAHLWCHADGTFWR